MRREAHGLPSTRLTSDRLRLVLVPILARHNPTHKLPDAEVLAICGHDWRRDPYSLETWAVFRPGQISRDEQHLRASEGRIFFAGAHTALRWTGFIDGAIESGI